MTYGFSGTAIEAAHSLNMKFFSVANRSLATESEMRADEELYNVRLFHSDIARSPFSFRQNYQAYKQIIQIIRENDVDYIHCNTPVGGILGRLVGKKCKVKKVIYQAHGFHFYKGAPKKNWLLYYPVEKWLARYTDALITINREDFELAKTKLKLRRNGKVYYVPGVGIDTSQYNSVNVSGDEKRRELGIPLDAFVLISAGELNQNKNNTVIISAMEKLKRNDIQYVLCGVGPLEGMLREQVHKAGLQNNVHFLGYRVDIKELFQMADCFVMTSYREGLSRSIMEAMASGLPCIASKIRGNTDLLDDTEGGYLCDVDDVSAYAEKINLLASHAELREAMGRYNLNAIRKFNMESVTAEIRNIYETEFRG